MQTSAAVTPVNSNRCAMVPERGGGARGDGARGDGARGDGASCGPLLVPPVPIVMAIFCPAPQWPDTSQP